VEAFHLDVTHYLLRPLSALPLTEALERAVRRMKAQPQGTLVRKVNGALRRIRVAEVSYVEAHGHYQTLHLLDGSQMVIRDTVEGLLQALQGVGRFARTHAAFVVNLDQVAEIDHAECIMQNGDHVPVARRQMKNVKMGFDS